MPIFYKLQTANHSQEMKKIIIFLSVFTLFLGSCSNGQKTAQEFYNETFKWKIKIPADLDTINSEKREKARGSGMQVIENTYGEKIEDYTIPIFTFSKGPFNIFEAMYEPFDPEVDGDFLETCKLVNEIVYTTFETQMPDAVIDTLTTVEQIDKLDFHVFKISITYPDGTQMNMLMYSRLFDKQSFDLNIIYRDEEIGQEMLDAWKNSTFEKESLKRNYIDKYKFLYGNYSSYGFCCRLSRHHSRA